MKLRPTTSSPRSRRWRVVVATVVLVLCGACLSVASAWGVAVKEAWRARPGVGMGGLLNRVYVSTPPDAGRWDVLIAHTQRPGFDRWTSLPLMDMGVPDRVAWPAPLAVPPADLSHLTSVSLYGWPSRSMHSTTVFAMGASAPTVETPQGAVVIPLGRSHAYMPLLPLWKGFLGNTVLFAGVLAVLVGVPRAGRRWVRARCGRCVGCGYLLKGVRERDEVCPECGVAIERRVER